ncbi:unnamed protein product [Adineta ricciae]|uniref:G-protein coupled receptors family 1 profile domain-containing protein n=1 Tax=Adineta ricciae TaxID=249248 RepID=A0A814P095_ADIRI|nr:unnamed protein product [Adineta ricciae]
MSLLQLYLLAVTGFIGIIFNWLLVLAIQRKIYHYQHSNRLAAPVSTKSLLRTQTSLTGHNVQPPVLPSVRSSVSMFDKFILAFLINDIFVCNFLLPLRLLDLAQGLPGGFLCFILKFFEKLSTIIELIIISLLLITTLIFFWKKRLITTKLWIILFLCIVPVLCSCLMTAFTFIDVEEYEQRNRPPTCKQTYIFMNVSTQKNCNTFCCLITYVVVFMNFILLIKTRHAIQIYRQNTLKTLTEAAMTTSKNDSSLYDQNSTESSYRRSMFYSISITNESLAPNATPPVRRSSQAIDYLAYLTIIENSHTLVRSTCLILIIYLIVHIPYWLSEFSTNELSSQMRDLFFLCHILKPLCYILTNEKYRHHVWAVLKCETFRMLPNLLRRKSRVVSVNNSSNNNANLT